MRACGNRAKARRRYHEHVKHYRKEIRRKARELVLKRRGGAPPRSADVGGSSAVKIAIESSSMSDAEAVIGASDHYARAELVTLAAEDAAPVFLDRRRVRLIEKGLPSAPYHHEALELDIGEAIELVNRVRRSVAEHARAAISTMLATYRVQVLILPASPYDSLPDSLEEILSSRPLTNAADGMLYRESLAEAAAELGVEVRRYPRKTDPTVLAAEAMGVDVGQVSSVIARFGREAGTPWRKDHKMAAAAALSVLGRRLSAPPRRGRHDADVTALEQN